MPAARSRAARAQPIIPPISAGTGISTTFDLLPIGVGIFDSELSLVYANAPFGALRDLPRELCRPGTPLTEIIRYNAMRGDFGSGDVDEQVAIRMAEIGRRQPREVEREYADGRHLLIRYTPVDGAGVMVTYTDVTHARRIEQSLRDNEERYALVTQAVAEGIYDWDIARNALWVSPRLIEIFGWEDGGTGAGERPSQEWNARVHPEDFQTYRAALRVALKGETPRLHCEYRIRLSSDEYRWVEDHGLPVRDQRGWSVRLVGAVSDVTERKESELEEALEYQTATSDVLRDISRSSFDLESMLTTVAETAARLCTGDMALIHRRNGDLYELAAAFGFSAEDEEFIGFVEHYPITPGRGTIVGLTALEGEVVHIGDVASLPRPHWQQRQVAGADVVWVEALQRRNFHTMLGVPLLREGEPIGVLAIARAIVRPFTAKQIRVVTTFADQAVIAIENARLLDEIRQRQAELRVTFDNMGDGVAMFGADLRLAAWNMNFQQILELPNEFLAQRPSFAEYFRYLADRSEYGSSDLEAELSRGLDDTQREMRFERTRPDGRVIEVRRNAMPGGGFVLIYSDVTERKRSEAEIRAARDAAETALRDLQAMQANLIHAQKMAALGQLTAGIAHEIKNPLNFVNNFAGLSVELLDELKDTAAPAIAALDKHKRAEIDETIATLTGNLERIAEHGRRADGIVKSMLAHSRGGAGDWQTVDLNGLVEEALNLAYHGARAQDQNFNIKLERDFDSALAPIEIVPQDMTRVFLNLIGNGFYAATKKSREPGSRPVLSVTTRARDEAVEIRVRDNGTGIAPKYRDRLFQPFFTTKPTGEGTGLGLSISYDIVTQQHGGTITVDSEPGAFTEFTVRLPRRGNSMRAERTA